MVDWDWLLYHLWDVWDDFDLSINWGNIATVAVATTAIIVSARFNVLTLRRSGAQFHQQRIDARDDKLRTEIADLCAAVSERRHQLNITYRSVIRIRPLPRRRNSRLNRT